MNDPLEQAIREARKALTCIYLIAEEVVADDVKNKMEDVFTAIIHALAQREREVWEEAAKCLGELERKPLLMPLDKQAKAQNDILRLCVELCRQKAKEVGG